MKNQYLIVLVLLLIVFSTAVVRFRLADVPLERDEGEYAYAGQLILQGIPPYKQFYNMKLPGIYAAYAGLLSVFGQTHTGIHLGLLVINAITILLVFFLAKRIGGPIAGLVAAACFSMLSMGQSIQGIFANAEHFVILPAVGGLLLLLRGLDDNRSWILFCSGLLFGVGFLMKQHGAAFAAFGGFYLVISNLLKKPINWLNLASQCLLFFLGVTCPYGLTCLIFYTIGLFDQFWFWTVDYAMAYSSQISIEYAWTRFINQATQIAKSAPLIWFLSCFGLSSLLWDRRSSKEWTFIVGFALFSCSAICPGWIFRAHYFILLLPVAAVLAGISISSLANKLANIRFRIVKNGLPIFLTVFCLALSVYQLREFLFELSPLQISRIIYASNPFPESLEISRFIRENTKPDDRIAIIGSEPQIYFHSKRQSATGYIYMFALMENHDFALQMQKEMIQEVELAKPKYLIFVNIHSSWLSSSDSNTLVIDWFQHYSRINYTLVGLVDIFKEKTRYYWAPEIKWPPGSPHWVSILERKNT